MSPCRSHPLAAGIWSRISGSLSLGMGVPLRCGGVGRSGRAGRRPAATGARLSIISATGPAEQGPSPRAGSAGRGGAMTMSMTLALFCLAVVGGEPARRAPAAGDGPDATPGSRST